MIDTSALAEDLLDVMFDAEPVEASASGFRHRDTLLPDVSEAGRQALRARLVAIEQRARSADPASLDLPQRLTLAVVAHQSRALISYLDSRTVEFAINGTFLAPVPHLLLQLSWVTLADTRQAQDFLTRLRRVPEFVDAVAQRHRDGIAAGRRPLRRHVQDAAAHLDRCTAEVTEDPLLTQPMHDEGLAAERVRVLSEVVYPALLRYRDVLTNEIEPHGREDDEPGLCHLPGGIEVYRAVARAHTATDLDPSTMHDIGLAILDGLRSEYAEIGGRVFGVSDPADVLGRLRSDPSLRWENGSELLDAARTAVARAETAAPEWFGRLPSQPCAVEPVPGAGGPGAPAGYYSAPAVDGSRGGTYFANTDRAGERPRYLSEAIAFHEATPGHHLQNSLALEREDLPALHRVVNITAYTEGWGLYAERLADEMGLYSDDVSRLGLLSNDALRAARLVVDTGLHAFGWSRDRAIEYLETHTAMPLLEVEAEVDRYIVWPGQALSYMIGREELLRLRGTTEQRLGSRFDVRAFHDTVLAHGSLPLSTLEQLLAEAL